MSSRGDGAAALLLGIGVLLVLAWMASALLGDRGVALPGWLFPGLGVAWLLTALLTVGSSAGRARPVHGAGQPRRPARPRDLNGRSRCPEVDRDANARCALRSRIVR